MRFPEQWEKSFRFGFVRNPWARMASFFWSAGESEFARRPDRRHDLDFVRQQFRAWMHTKGLERLADPNMNAQHQLVLPGGGLQVHFVGRTECMVEDLTYVAEKIGQKVPDPLPRENVFKLDVPHWREMYDNDTSRIVRTLSTFEVHYLRYTFEEDLPARRASIGEP